MASKLVTLDEWRLAHDLTHKELGKLLGCSGRMAWIYCCKPSQPAFRLPRPDRMAKIYEATKGEVPPASFYQLPKLLPGSDPYYAPELPMPPPEERRVA